MKGKPLGRVCENTFVISLARMAAGLKSSLDSFRGLQPALARSMLTNFRIFTAASSRVIANAVDVDTKKIDAINMAAKNFLKKYCIATTFLTYISELSLSKEVGFVKQAILFWI